MSTEYESFRTGYRRKRSSVAAMFHVKHRTVARSGIGKSTNAK